MGETGVQIRDNVVPSWSDELIKKTTAKRDFNRAEEVMYLILQDSNEAEAVRGAEYIRDEHPTALENLYVIVLLMLRLARQNNPLYSEKKNALFLDAFVIDQSPDTYTILLDLLQKTREMSSTKTDREKEIVDFLFDGFS